MAVSETPSKAFWAQALGNHTSCIPMNPTLSGTFAYGLVFHIGFNRCVGHMLSV